MINITFFPLQRWKKKKRLKLPFSHNAAGINWLAQSSLLTPPLILTLTLACSLLLCFGVHVVPLYSTLVCAVLRQNENIASFERPNGSIFTLWLACFHGRGITFEKKKEKKKRKKKRKRKKEEVPQNEGTAFTFQFVCAFHGNLVFLAQLSL